MNKTNMVYRHITEESLKNRKAVFIGRTVAKILGISPDTVSSALAPLKRIGAVTIYRRHFEIINFKKILLFWCVNRKLDKDIVYSTYAELKDIGELEDRLPEGIAYTNYSGYVKNFKNDAATYGEVYAYATENSLKEIKLRFPMKKFSKRSDYRNLFILKPDKVLEMRILTNKLQHSSVTLPQLYADLWNTNSWYAYEFLMKLEKRIDDIYANAILE